MEYFSVVYSISLGKSQAPSYTLKYKGGVSDHLAGKAAELQKVQHTIV